MNKKKNAIHNQKHLTLSDRTFIEQELIQGSSFKSIADVLGKDPTTISKEVKLHRVFYENHTMILKLLAKNNPDIVFKGGTSLSKCFHLINRLPPYSLNL